MAMHPALLDLEKDPGALAKEKNTHFLLSFRDQQEFSSLHSFGLFKVPHVGVYGMEYTLCSAMGLLSLPAVPRLLKRLPPDLISALDLNTVLRGQENLPPTSPFFSPGQLSLSSPLPPSPSPSSPRPLAAQPSEAALVSVARHLVARVLESACRKVAAMEAEERMASARSQGRSKKRVALLCVGDEGERRRGRGTLSHGSAADMEVSVTVPVIQVSMDVDSSTTAAPTPMRVGGRGWSGPVADEATLLDVAKRLVLKCIRSACHTLLEAESGHSEDPIDDLISITKRMRISSPSPCPSEDEGEEIPIPPPTPPPSPTAQSPPPPLSLPATTGRDPSQQRDPPERSSTPERCLTPESLWMQNKRKKRGRSDSHEVNSLVDYEMIRRHFSGSKLDKGTIEEEEEEEEGGSEQDEDTLVTLVSNMEMMKIDSGSMGRERGGPVPSKTPRNANSPFTHRGLATTTTTPPRPAHVGLGRRTANMGHVIQPVPRTPATDPRRAANMGAVPHMDVYVILHSCPPRGLCQKFLCSNTDEINLLYHSWLFPDAAYNPQLTLTDKVAVGVFEVCGVRPVHTELLDAGAPFHYLEERTVCIHNCCFSPNNAQLQLDWSHSSTTNTRAFHTFYSAGRHGEKRVVSLHVLPVSSSVEEGVREVLTRSNTTRQLLTLLHSTYPDLPPTISTLLSAL